ncbi:hypothetical protein V1460_25065 [Streptomyces sp. SCSIO 30461]|uniref:hypothetical protein n=1 Tax=Streptomyces sp. SCSIO 30461 TaxID=3118085 RepID=UPI0030CE4689
MNLHEANHVEPGVPDAHDPEQFAVDEALVAFVTARMHEAGQDGPVTDGVLTLLAAYDELHPVTAPWRRHDWQIGVIDGLGQALRHIATGWDQHPDYRYDFAPDELATRASAWTDQPQPEPAVAGW